MERYDKIPIPRSGYIDLSKDTIYDPIEMEEVTLGEYFNRLDGTNVLDPTVILVACSGKKKQIGASKLSRVSKLFKKGYTSEKLDVLNYKCMKADESSENAPKNADLNLGFLVDVQMMFPPLSGIFLRLGDLREYVKNDRNVRYYLTSKEDSHPYFLIPMIEREELPGVIGYNYYSHRTDRINIPDDLIDESYDVSVSHCQYKAQKRYVIFDTIEGYPDESDSDSDEESIGGLRGWNNPSYRDIEELLSLWMERTSFITLNNNIVTVELNEEFEMTYPMDISLIRGLENINHNYTVEIFVDSDYINELKERDEDIYQHFLEIKVDEINVNYDEEMDDVAFINIDIQRWAIETKKYNFSFMNVIGSTLYITSTSDIIFAPNMDLDHGEWDEVLITVPEDKKIEGISYLKEYIMIKKLDV